MMADREPRQRMSLSLPADLVDWVRAKADLDDVTISAVVEKAINNLRKAVEDRRRRGK